MYLNQVTPSTPGELRGTDSAAMYAPEPSTSGIGTFADTLRSAAGTVESVLSKSIGGVPLEVSGGFAELLQAQIQAQIEMQTVSLVSNIERSKHETKMSAIRNIRLS